MRESEVETYLRKEVEKIGGMCKKWVCPGTRAVPDRICIMPDGLVVFVEVKRPGGELRKNQKLFLDELQSLGANAWLISSKKEVELFIDTQKLRMKIGAYYE